MTDDPSTVPITAVVFDIGGVLLDWSPAHLYRQLISDPEELEHFLTVVAPLSWHWQHDRGVPMAETLPVRSAEFPEHAELLAQWQLRYLDMIGGAVPGTAEVVEDVRAAGRQIYGLSNMPAEVWPGLVDAWPVLARFDGVIVSGEERLVKPEPAIFDVLVERFGLDRANTVFVDDTPVNVVGARASGLQAIRFTDAEQLRADLRRLGVLTA